MSLISVSDAAKLKHGVYRVLPHHGAAGGVGWIGRRLPNSSSTNCELHSLLGVVILTQRRLNAVVLFDFQLALHTLTSVRILSL